MFAAGSKSWPPGRASAVRLVVRVPHGRAARQAPELATPRLWLRVLAQPLMPVPACGLIKSLLRESLLLVARLVLVQSLGPTRAFPARSSRPSQANSLSRPSRPAPPSNMASARPLAHRCRRNQ